MPAPKKKKSGEPILAASSRKKKAPPKEKEMDLDVSGQEEFDNLYLTKAMRLVHGDRAAQYGHPREVYSKVIPMWMGILGIPVSYEKFCFCMIALKMARELTTPGGSGDDNFVDIAGYIAVLNRIHLDLAYKEEAGGGSV